MDYISKDYNQVGRAGEIRTLDPLHPMQVRYQTALRPDFKNEMCTNGSDDVKLKMYC